MQGFYFWLLHYLIAKTLIVVGVRVGVDVAAYDVRAHVGTDIAAAGSVVAAAGSLVGASDSVVRVVQNRSSAEVMV